MVKQWEKSNRKRRIGKGFRANGAQANKIEDRKLELESLAVVILIWKGKILLDVYPVDL